MAPESLVPVRGEPARITRLLQVSGERMFVFVPVLGVGDRGLLTLEVDCRI